MRAGEVRSGNPGGRFDGSRYELTDEERRAFERRDPAALYRLGLHPVLLHGFCRAVGYRRDEYREMLAAESPPAPGSEPEPSWERTGRWQR